jgi:hypothetical protein
MEFGLELTMKVQRFARKMYIHVNGGSEETQVAAGKGNSWLRPIR